MLNFYTCAECGNVMLETTGGKQACKSPNLKRIEPNAAEGTSYVPDVSIEDTMVVVRVKKMPNPMTLEHCVEWVMVQTSAGGTFCNLLPGDPSEIKFPIAPQEVVSVYAYCGPHGLWKAPEPVFPQLYTGFDAVCSPEFAQGCINPLQNDQEP